jgi:hypothetical protein
MICVRTQSLGNLELGLGIKEGVGELLALTERTLDDAEAVDIREVVLDGLVRGALGLSLGRVNSVRGGLGGGVSSGRRSRSIRVAVASAAHGELLGIQLPVGKETKWVIGR